MNDTESRAAKILKILAKAEGTDNPHEAETFFQQAAALQARWEIDDAMLAATKPADASSIAQKRIACTGTYAVAVQELCWAIGTAKGFSMAQSGSGNHRVAVWMGFEQDLADAEVLFTSLLTQQAHAVAAHMKTWTPDYFETVSDNMQRFKSKRSFMIGFAYGVRDQLLTIKKEAERAAAEARAAERGTDTATAAEEVGLVLVSKAEAITSWVEENMRLGKARNRGVDLTGDMHAGSAAGRNAATGGKKALTR